MTIVWGQLTIYDGENDDRYGAIHDPKTDRDLPHNRSFLAPSLTWYYAESIVNCTILEALDDRQMPQNRMLTFQTS